MTDLTGIGISLCAAIAYSTKAIFAKIGYHYGVDPHTMLLLRMLFSLPFFIVLLLSSHSKLLIRPSWKEHLQIAGLGIFGFYISAILDFEGLQFITANLERIIVFSYPSLVVLISFILFNRRLSQRDLFALIISYLGLIIACRSEISTGNHNTWVGCALVFGCAITYAFYLTLSERLIKKFGTTFFISYALIAATTAMSLYATLLDPAPLLQQPREVYNAALGMALISTVIASFCMTEGIKRIGASKSAIIGTVGPIATIYMAHLVLGEALTAYQAIGGLLVMSGVVALTLSKAKITANAAEAST